MFVIENVSKSEDKNVAKNQICYWSIIFFFNKKENMAVFAVYMDNFYLSWKNATENCLCQSLNLLCYILLCQTKSSYTCVYMP